MKFTSNNRIALAGTLLVHLVILVLLWLITLNHSVDLKNSQSGVPVMLGEVELSSGNDDPGTLNGPDQLPKKSTQSQDEPVQPVAISRPIQSPPKAQKLITQTTDPSLALKAEKEKAEKLAIERKQVAIKKAEQAAQEERVRVAEHAKAVAAAAAAARSAAANSKVAAALGRGFGSGSKGSSTSGNGVQGNPKGNSSEGASSGVVGNGTVSLGLRTLRGTLPSPAYGVNEEGTVVVNITVNAAGIVINATINNSRSNTANGILRNAALSAARRASFNSSDTQREVGTITYKFKLK